MAREEMTQADTHQTPGPRGNESQAEQGQRGCAWSQGTWRSDSKAVRMGSNPKAGGPGMRLRERKDEAPPGQGSLHPTQPHATRMEGSPAALPGGAMILVHDPTPLRKFSDPHIHPGSSWGSSQGIKCPRQAPGCSWQGGGTHSRIPATLRGAPGRGVWAGCICRASHPHPCVSACHGDRPGPPKRPHKTLAERASALQALVLTGAPRWWASPGPASLPRCIPVLPAAL